MPAGRGGAALGPSVQQQHARGMADRGGRRRRAERVSGHRVADRVRRRRPRGHLGSWCLLGRALRHPAAPAAARGAAGRLTKPKRCRRRTTSARARRAATPRRRGGAAPMRRAPAPTEAPMRRQSRAPRRRAPAAPLSKTRVEDRQPAARGSRRRAAASRRLATAATAPARHRARRTAESTRAAIDAATKKSSGRALIGSRSRGSSRGREHRAWTRWAPYEFPSAPSLHPQPRRRRGAPPSAAPPRGARRTRAAVARGSYPRGPWVVHRRQRARSRYRPPRPRRRGCQPHTTPVVSSSRRKPPRRASASLARSRGRRPGRATPSASARRASARARAPSTRERARG